MGTVLARIKLLLVILAALLPAAGCSSLPQAVPAGALPLRTYEDVVKEGMSPMFEVDDSLEGFNRGVYRFNYYFDEFLFRPVVRTYETIMPDYAEERVSSAIDNIGEVGNLANNLLQLKFKAAGITVSRFVINSTVGVAGLWDSGRRLGPQAPAGGFRPNPRPLRGRERLISRPSGPGAIQCPGHNRPCRGLGSLHSGRSRCLGRQCRHYRGLHRHLRRGQAAPDTVPLSPDRFAVRVRIAPDAVHHEAGGRRGQLTELGEAVTLAGLSRRIATEVGTVADAVGK